MTVDVYLDSRKKELLFGDLRGERDWCWNRAERRSCLFGRGRSFNEVCISVLINLTEFSVWAKSQENWGEIMKIEKI